MGVSWDWLRPLITAPYIPALGPVHPQAGSPPALPNIADTASADCFGGPPCTGGSGTRPPASFCRPKSAAHRIACANRKGLTDLGLICTTTLRETAGQRPL